MAEKQNEFEKGPYQPSVKILGMALAVWTVFIGSLPVAYNKLTPEARNNPCTGDQCRSIQRQVSANTERLHEIEQWDEQHERWGRDLSTTQARIDARQDARIEELYRRLP